MRLLSVILAAASFTGSAHAVVVHEGQHFKVYDQSNALSIFSPTTMVRNFGSWATAFSDHTSPTGHFTDGDLHGPGMEPTWVPDTGYEIVGFQITYRFTFSGMTWVVNGDEWPKWPFVGLQPGDTWRSMGVFTSSNGYSRTFSAPYDNGLQTFDAFVPGSQYSDLISLTAYGVNDFCPRKVLCDQNPFVEAVLLTTLSINTLHITPVLVPVPEPESYVLLLSGLAALAVSRRRKRPGVAP